MIYHYNMYKEYPIYLNIVLAGELIAKWQNQLIIPDYNKYVMCTFFGYISVMEQTNGIAFKKFDYDPWVI